MKKYKYNWLIILVIHDFQSDADIAHTNHILDTEIKATGIKEHHCLVVVHEKFISTGPVKFETSIKKLVAGQEPGTFEFEEIKKVDFDFHAQRSWEELLQWINQQFPARYICLNTLSHGAGFGVLGDPVSGEKEVRFGKTGFIHQRYFSKTDEFSRFLPERSGQYLVIQQKEKDPFCKALQMLWVTELADAIKAGFGARQVDVLMMNNCFMQNFETGWLLRKQVNYLVAPEPRFTSFGYAYDGLLHRINKNPDITPDELIKTIKPDFIKKWQLQLPQDLKLVGMSIVDLSWYGPLKIYFEQIARLLLQLEKAQLLKIVEARQKKIRNVSNGPAGTGASLRVYLIDLLYFYDILLVLFPGNREMAFAISRFRFYFTKALKEHHTGEEFLAEDNTREDKYNLQGISIFLPANLDAGTRGQIANCAYFGRPIVRRPDENNIPLFQPFVKHSQWDEFVKKYLQCL